jgi:hypothetical protein
MFFEGMPLPADGGPRTASIFCALSYPGCRQMVLVSNMGKALAAKKIVVAGQLWCWSDGAWRCDRCTAAE